MRLLSSTERLSVNVNLPMKSCVIVQHTCPPSILRHLRLLGILNIIHCPVLHNIASERVGVGGRGESVPISLISTEVQNRQPSTKVYEIN